MGEKNEPSSFPTLKFPFLSLTAAAGHSPDHHPPPPLETLASVPFKWEEKPGKPRPCTDIIPIPGLGKRLEPPPCRLQLLTDSSNGRITKMPSPTTVLDGPDTVARPRFSSFRLYRESFDGSAGGDSPYSSADALLRDGGGHKRRGFFGRGLMFKSNGKSKEVGGSSFGFSSPSSAGGFSEVKRNGSFSSLSQPAPPRPSASIYQRLKLALVPWKSAKTKSKKDELHLKV